MWPTPGERGGVRPAGLLAAGGWGRVPAAAAGGAWRSRARTRSVDAALGPYTSSEQELADRLWDSLGEGMLCLADRGFYSFDRFQNGRSDGGAAALAGERERCSCRASSTLSDGSYLTHISQRQSRPARRAPWPRSARRRVPARRSRARRGGPALPAAHHDPRPRRGARERARCALPRSAGSSRQRSTS